MKRWRFTGFWLCVTVMIATLSATGASAASTAPLSEGAEGVPLLSWNTSPATIVMQVNERGGLAAPQATEMPLWTLYGDGFVVWTESGPPTPGFARQVWMGKLTQDQMNELVAAADELGFWALNSSYSDPSLVVAPPAGGQAIQIGSTMQDQRSSTVMVNLTEQRHSVTAYPPSSANVPAAWTSFRSQLLAMRPADAALYQPTSFLLRARTIQSMTLANGAPVAAWPFTDIVLLNVLTQPMQLEAGLGTEIGDFLIANRYVTQQGGTAYNLKLFGSPPRLTVLQ